jgi:hypothetical protein
VSEPQRKMSDIPVVTGVHAEALPQAAQAHLARSSVTALTVGALGVVFGDIGTSPLYAMRNSVQAIGASLPLHFAVMAALSLIFWSLMIVVTLKYVTLIMRADNDGEGGVLALAALAHRSHRIGRRFKRWIGVAAILGLALFFGDGMLTPAISVLSAVEGLAPKARASCRSSSRSRCHSDRPVPDAEPRHGRDRQAVRTRSCWCGSRRSRSSEFPRSAHAAILEALNPYYGVLMFCARHGRDSWRSARWFSPSRAARRFTRTWAISAKDPSAMPGSISCCRHSC